MDISKPVGTPEQCEVEGHGMAQIHTGGNSSVCSGGHLHLTNKAFVDIFITSAAELPGLLAASLVMDWAGRKW